MSASDPQPPAVSGLTRMAEKMREEAHELFSDAASWRDVADKGGPFDPKITQNERRSAELNEWADEIERTSTAVDDAVARLTAEKADLVEQNDKFRAQVEFWERRSETVEEILTARDRLQAENARLREERDAAVEEARMGHVRLDECSDMGGTGHLTLYNRIGVKLLKNAEQRREIEARYPELPADINEWLAKIAADRAEVASLRATLAATEEKQ